MTHRDPLGPVRVRVPAQLTLHLSVGRRPDATGRNVVSVCHAVDVYDEVTIAASSRLSVRTVGAAGVPRGSKNLAGAAATALADALGRTPAVSIEVDKRIPVSGGLSGASADAAGALLGCATLWGANLTREELSDVGAAVDPGVPFALSGGTAVGTGPGQRISPVLARSPLHWVLALTDGNYAAADAYRELDRLRESGPTRQSGPVQDILTAIASGNAAVIGAELSNDLQPAAVSLYPPLRRTLRAGMDAGAVGGVVTGAGPTVAFLTEHARAAQDVAAELAGSGACRSVRVATGPVSGARLVGNE